MDTTNTKSFLDSLEDETGEDSNNRLLNTDKLIITEEFKNAYDLISNTNENVFITGDAGSGKSTFLQYLYKNLRKNKKIVFLSPTGVAANNMVLMGIPSQTIHSFFKFPPKPLTIDKIPEVKPEDLPKFQNIDTIVIDEISMVRSDVLNAIDVFLKYNLSSRLPFAGKQIVMVGDLCQLPPVVGTPAEKEMIAHLFGSEFFFDAEVLKHTHYHKIRFTRAFRQNDENFIAILNRMKYGRTTLEDLDFINKNCNDGVLFDQVPIICTTNKMVDMINSKLLVSNPNPIFKFVAEIEGEFDKKNCLLDEIIEVKKGSIIMMLTNNRDQKWVNGSTAEFLDYDYDTKTAKLRLHHSNEVIGVQRMTIENSKYNYNKQEKKMEENCVGKITQFGFCLSYARSIHKSQSMTYEKMNIHSGSGFFMHGLSYVAFSRCKSLEGIKIYQPLQRRDIIIDKRIITFLENNNLKDQ